MTTYQKLKRLRERRDDKQGLLARLVYSNPNKVAGYDSKVMRCVGEIAQLTLQIQALEKQR